MEDFVRLEIAQKAPHLRETVEDLKKTSWKDLLDFGRTYLGFTENDCRIISEANFQRNEYAHGGDYTYTYYDLKKYAGFVKKWCPQENTAVENDWEKEKPIVEPRPTNQPAYQPVSRATRSSRK